LNPAHPASPGHALSTGIATEPSGPGSGPTGYYLGSDLRAAYAAGVTLDGTGQAVGIFSMGGYRLSDIEAYFTAQGKTLTVPIVSVLVDGMDGSCDSACDDTESAMDIELAMALAPNLSAVIFYEGSTPADIFAQMATDNVAEQLSSSYVFVADPAVYEPIFEEFAAQGQSFVSSSGDGGAFSPPGCASNCWNSLFPADDPWVTAVGGTVLTTSGAGGAWSSETAWPSSGGAINDSGYAILSYQAPLINASNQGSATLRNIPDVAAVATGVFITANGDQGGSGGTSASAPLGPASWRL
jgi:subtilase family serine protease